MFCGDVTPFLAAVRTVGRRGCGPGGAGLGAAPPGIDRLLAVRQDALLVTYASGDFGLARIGADLIIHRSSW